MTQQKALLPQVLDQHFANSWISNATLVTLSVLALGLLAQVSIALPYTPVPITGQTYGVGVIALLLGRKRAVSVLVLYLGLGAFGAPLFAQASSGLMLGPSMGYLVGMLAAAYVMGYLSDIGFSNTFFKCYLSLFVGSWITFSFGTLVLALFLPTEALFAAGVAPFLLGDLIKTILAATTVTGFQAIGRHWTK